MGHGHLAREAFPPCRVFEKREGTGLLTAHKCYQVDTQHQRNSQPPRRPLSPLSLTYSFTQQMLSEQPLCVSPVLEWGGKYPLHH